MRANSTTPGIGVNNDASESDTTSDDSPIDHMSHQSTLSLQELHRPASSRTMHSSSRSPSVSRSSSKSPTRSRNFDFGPRITAIYTFSNWHAK